MAGISNGRVIDLVGGGLDLTYNVLASPGLLQKGSAFNYQDIRRGR